MPLFEFKCKKCDQVFEELVRTHSEKVQCPTCESNEVTKLLSTFGVSTGASNPCANGACGLPEPMPQCGQGACPSCMD